MYRTEDFASASPPPRIIGTEMEYHFQPESINPKVIAKRLGQLGLSLIGQYSSNGARVYPEFGIEYASPECLGPSQAATADFTGMAIINHLTSEKATEFPILRLSGSFNPNTKTGDSRGYHQNFLTPLPSSGADQELVMSVLSSYLATRIIWDGSGMSTPDGFLLSQKAPGIGRPVERGFGNRTEHGKKPLAGFLAADGNASDKVTKDWALVEVRSADAHMSKTQAYASLAVTSLVLRLLEQRVINHHNADRFIINNPIGSLRALNREQGRSALQLASGKKTTAQGLQERLATAALSLTERVRLPDDEIVAARRYLDLCQKLKQLSDCRALARDVEWAAKKFFIKQKYGENPLDIDATAFDLQWHRIDDKSVGLRVYKKLDPWMSLEEDGATRLEPPKTRAAARGAAIKSGICKDVSWNRIVLNNGEPIQLDDYWSSELPPVAQKLIVKAA